MQHSPTDTGLIPATKDLVLNRSAQKTTIDVLGLIKNTSKKYNQTILMITHNESIAQMADRIIRIEDGKIFGGDEFA